MKIVITLLITLPTYLIYKPAKKKFIYLPTNPMS